MKSLKFGMFLLTLLVSVVSLAQTADEIVSKHINAIGGRDKINNIKTVQIESVMNIMGNDAPMTTTIVNGKAFKNEVEFGGQKIINVLTDKGGWMINPMMGATDAQPIPEDQVKLSKDEINVGGPLLNYAAQGGKVELK
ncbi:MAG TPA: hypothetical protein VFQ58_08425 [Flavisolibacter sp.]|nr:hypothetical protein [Flavisolibacter sp.]